MLHAIDVGGIDEGESGRNVRIGLDPEAPGLDAGERARAERPRVVGIGEDDGGSRRRPEDAGRAGGPAGDRVEERALAGSRRAEQEHDQGRVKAAGANPDMAREVVAQPCRTGPCGIGPGGQRDAAAGERLEPVDELSEACGGYDRLSLGAVLHLHRVAPGLRAGTAEGPTALSVPLQTRVIASPGRLT